MATTRGKGTPGTRASAAPADPAVTAGETQARPRRTRTRAPEDEIGGTVAPEAAVQAAAPARGRGRRAAPPAGVADMPAVGLTEAGTLPEAGVDAPRPTRGRGRTDAEKLSPVERASGKRGGRKKRETYTETAARRRKEKEVDQLREDLRAFAIARPSGWNHDDWVAFLGHLSKQGHDVSDNGAIGARLERERLAVALESIEGLGPKRVHSLVERFHTLWSMRHADAAAIATVAGMTRPLAERVAQQLRERYS